MAFWRGYWTIGAALTIALGLILLLVLPETPWWTGFVAGGATLVLAFPATHTVRQRWLDLLGEDDDLEPPIDDDGRGGR